MFLVNSNWVKFKKYSGPATLDAGNGLALGSLSTASQGKFIGITKCEAGTNNVRVYYHHYSRGDMKWDSMVEECKK